MGGYRICREKILTEEPPQTDLRCPVMSSHGCHQGCTWRKIFPCQRTAVAGLPAVGLPLSITPALTTMEHPLGV